jgi:hypothetical protein
MFVIALGTYPLLSTFPAIHGPEWEITALSMAAIAVAVAAHFDARSRKPK